MLSTMYGSAGIDEAALMNLVKKADAQILDGEVLLKTATDEFNEATEVLRGITAPPAVKAYLPDFVDEMDELYQKTGKVEYKTYSNLGKVLDASTASTSGRNLWVHKQFGNLFSRTLPAKAMEIMADPANGKKAVRSQTVKTVSESITRPAKKAGKDPAELARLTGDLNVALGDYLKGISESPANNRGRIDPDLLDLPDFAGEKARLQGLLGAVNDVADQLKVKPVREIIEDRGLRHTIEAYVGGLLSGVSSIFNATIGGFVQIATELPIKQLDAYIGKFFRNTDVAAQVIPLRVLARSVVNTMKGLPAAGIAFKSALKNLDKAGASFGPRTSISGALSEHVPIPFRGTFDKYTRRALAVYGQGSQYAIDSVSRQFLKQTAHFQVVSSVFQDLKARKLKPGLSQKEAEGLLNDIYKRTGDPTKTKANYNKLNKFLVESQ